MKRLDGWPAARAEKHATALLHDEPHYRVVAFTLAPNQEVPTHASGASVLVHVIAGNGEFRGGADHVQLNAGESITYPPNEPHGMRAGNDGLRFLAVIAPSPSHLPSSHA